MRLFFNMLRSHSTRVLGRQLLPSSRSCTSSSSSLRSAVVAAAHRPPWVSTHASNSAEISSWLVIAPRKSSLSALIGCNSSPLSWTCARQILGNYPTQSASAFSGTSHGTFSSRQYATGSGGGDGSGGGSRGGGSGGGSADGAGAGDEGRWRIWSWYLGLLDTRPILTKAVTSAILTFIGDMFCQYVLEKAEELDGKRVAVMTFLGFALVGPTLHYWYTTLSKLVTIGGPAGVGIRLILDQFLFSPIFIATFISSLLTLEGKSNQIPAKLKQDWWSALLVNWQLWIPAQVINFWLVPLKLQVAFANFTALFWNAYLSYKSHVRVADDDDRTIETKI